jgi:hypothetical protein
VRALITDAFRIRCTIPINDRGVKCNHPVEYFVTREDGTAHYGCYRCLERDLAAARRAGKIG